LSDAPVGRDVTGAKPRLGVVTGDRAPTLSEDGKRVAEGLEARGYRVDPVHWADESVEWAEYDAALFRSCWDYDTDPERFFELIRELERAALAVYNPLPVVRWNVHKSYLADLQTAGVDLPTTTVVERGSDRSLEAVLDAHGIDEAVVKPAVGTSSKGVWRTVTADAPAVADRFGAMVAEGDVVVQEFAPEIEGGERSMVFLGGEYSHAWNSLTADGDVTAFEGIDADYEPGPGIRAAARDTLRTAGEVLGLDVEGLPYARVDYVHRAGELLVMELELVEPYLGLDRGEGAVDRFCEALVAAFRGRGVAPA
jgi:hypothetical protein